ncbi:MAG: arylesterase [Longimicrobiales bacterium]
MRIIAVALIVVSLAACDETQPAPVPTSAPAPAQADTRGVILFIGTSLTAGYGVGAEYAYPALIQAKLDSAGLPYRVVNAGISGETSAGGLRRIDWALQQPTEVLVLELGANDGLRGLDPDSMKRNLEALIRRTREKYPTAEIVIAGMQAPPNLGAQYTHRFHAVYGDLADKFDAVLIPFLLEGVAARPELNQSDGIHPTVEGQRVIAETVWMHLKPVL